MESFYKNPEDIYPLTIVADRYRGSYSGGLYLAFNLYIENIPEEIGSDDVSEMNFWGKSNKQNHKIGRGDTPDLALKDLHERLKTTKS